MAVLQGVSCSVNSGSYAQGPITYQPDYAGMQQAVDAQVEQTQRLHQYQMQQAQQQQGYSSLLSGQGQASGLAQALKQDNASLEQYLTRQEELAAKEAQKARDKAFQSLTEYKTSIGQTGSTVKVKEKISMFKEFKTFLADHRDLIFTTLLLMAADSFFLKGALRDRLTSILKGVVDKMEKKVVA